MTAHPSPRGGRPSREASAALADAIVDAATVLFLRDGFVATSMEAVAANAGVSKRTLYSRFADKPVLFEAAVARLIAAWLPGFDAAIEHAATLEQALLLAARSMLATALAPEALALYRLLIAEAERIPNLPALLQQAGAGAGIARIGALLRRHGVRDPFSAAAQFQRLVLTGPQHQSLIFGAPLAGDALQTWPENCVALFLHGAEPRGKEPGDERPPQP